jgi:hypothetical protein
LVEIPQEKMDVAVGGSLLEENPQNEKQRNEDPVPVVPRGHASSIGGFLRRTQRNLIELPRNIIQIIPVDNVGHFVLWAMVDEELHRMKLIVPRIFYAHQRSIAPNSDESNPQITWKKGSSNSAQIPANLQFLQIPSSGDATIHENSLFEWLEFEEELYVFRIYLINYIKSLKFLFA